VPVEPPALSDPLLVLVGSSSVVVGVPEVDVVPTVPDTVPLADVVVGCVPLSPQPTTPSETPSTTTIRAEDVILASYAD
jgi:hypothetical protein